MPELLEGVKVLDLAQLISGPLATMMLADQGAQVTKVENTGIGDLMRLLGTQRNGVTALFANCNRGKRSIAVDLKHDDGVAVLHELVRSADVLVQNFRPGAAARVRADYDTVRAINPDLVYVSISGFGASGPYATKRVYDNVIQAYSGFAGVQEDRRTGDPTLVRQLVCDKVTAYQTAQAITAALLARALGNAGGQHIEIAMLDAAVAFVWPDAAMDIAALADDVLRTPTIGSIYNATKLADGFITGGMVSDAEFQGVATALGAPELADDPRFATIGDRSANMVELGRALNARYMQTDTERFVQRAEELDLPFAPIRRLHEVPDDPQAVHNDLFSVVDHPQLGPLRTVRHAPRYSHTPAQPVAPSPALGEHSEAILRELGYADDRIGRLRDQGTII